LPQRNDALQTLEKVTVTIRNQLQRDTVKSKAAIALLLGLSAGAAFANPRFTPATYDFGSVQVGSSATVTVFLDQDPGYPDHLRTLGIAAGTALTNATTFGDFTLDYGNCTFAANGPTGSPLTTGCTFSLTYAPTTAGTANAVVTATDYQLGLWGTMAVSATAAPASAPASIPTLSEWGLIGLSSLLAMFGLSRMRRRG